MKKQLSGNQSNQAETDVKKAKKAAKGTPRARGVGGDEATGTHPGDQKGVTGPGAFSFGDIDAVNIFNGNLTLKIPIGLTFSVGGNFSWGLTLHHNSKVWDYEAGKRGHVDVHFNAGLGWWLSFGHLHEPGEKGGHPSYWVFISSDGSSHQFSDSLRHELPAPQADKGTYFYTRDGSYLRLKVAGTNSRTIEFPDGRIQSFDRQGRTTELRDRHGNFVKVEYKGNDWEITDRHGRVVNVLFDASILDPNDLSAAKPQIREVNYAGFGGQPVKYEFKYREQEGQSIYKKNIPIEIYRKAQINGSVRVPLLDYLILPDGSPYAFDYYLNNGQKADPEGSGVDIFEVPGRIRSLTLPTGGRYEWEYASYFYIEMTEPDPPNPSGGGDRPPHRSPTGDDGVFYKKMFRSNGQEEARWRYRPISNAGTRPGTPENNQTRVEVTDPMGNRTMHYFYRQDTDWKTGLPFSLVESHEVDGLKCFISREVFDKNGTRLRKEFVRYTADPVAFLRAANPRMTAHRTVFWDDGQQYVEKVFSEFDGLGNFRRTKTKGNLHGKRAAVDFINWNPFSRTFDYDRMDSQYGKNDFDMPKSSDPWVLKIIGAKIRQEAGKQSKTKYFFQRKTGFMLGKRVQLGDQPHPDDRLELYQPDGFGNVLKTSYYGGDSGGLAASNDYGVLVNNLPDPDYEVANTYMHGARITSKYLGGDLGDLFLLNRIVDKNTGLTSKEWDASKMATAYDYDEMGRVRKVTPVDGGGASTFHEYTVKPNGTRIKTFTKEAPGPNHPELTISRMHFDDFGRVEKEEQAFSISPLKWAERYTVYNPNGQKEKVSEWGFGRTGKVTEYRQYDPFGRVGKVITPDGYATTFEYKGQREVKRTVQVRTGSEGSEPTLKASSTFEYYDHLGRLFRVREPSSSAGGLNRTDYFYDIGNRLAQVKQFGIGKEQTRTFTYDNRGFLTEEKHPEKGMNGNGIVKYKNIDAKGRPRQVDDGRSILTYVYDKAERLKAIKEGDKEWKSFEYAKTNGSGGNWRLGKIETAIRYNYVTIPGQTNELAVAVTETYAYKGKLGKASSRRTNIYLSESENHTFDQTFEYDALGNPTRLSYPVKTPGNPHNTLPRSIMKEYAAGRLASVKGLRANGSVQETYASAISYHANGMPHEVQHGNGVRYVWDKHPDDMARPHIIRVSFPGGGEFARGPHHFDGAGNIMRIEAGNSYEDYQYDHVSRLVKCRNGGGGWQEYSFDPFGNLHQINDNGKVRKLDVNAATNRFEDIAYDASGNQLHSHHMPDEGINRADYLFDSLNMIWGISCGDLFYFNIYTADNERVWHLRYRKSTGTFESGTFSIRDLAHRVMRQFKSEGPNMWIERDYVYRGAALLATNNKDEGVLHAHPDHLGSPMGHTDAQGNHKSIHFYHGFGEEYTNPDSDAIPIKFTGHERDAMEKGCELDYMHARFYSPLFGRFLSVDPAKSWKAKHPQSWNRYAYALGNPLRYVDPDGKQTEVSFWDFAKAKVEFDLGKMAARAIAKRIHTHFAPRIAQATVTVGLRVYGATGSAATAAGAATATTIVGSAAAAGTAAYAGYKIGQVLDESTAVGKVADWVVEKASDMELVQDVAQHIPGSVEEVKNLFSGLFSSNDETDTGTENNTDEEEEELDPNELENVPIR